MKSYRLMKYGRIWLCADGPPLTYEVCRHAGMVWEMFRSYFANQPQEHFVTAFLNGKNRFIGWNVVSIGTATASLVHPRDVFAPALMAQACAIILMHNHPSGDPTSSTDDRALTQRLVWCGEQLGVVIQDHVIFGGTTYYGMADHDELRPLAGEVRK